MCLQAVCMTRPCVHLNFLAVLRRFFLLVESFLCRCLNVCVYKILFCHFRVCRTGKHFMSTKKKDVFFEIITQWHCPAEIIYYRWRSFRAILPIYFPTRQYNFGFGNCAVLVEALAMAYICCI